MKRPPAITLLAVALTTPVLAQDDKATASASSASQPQKKDYVSTLGVVDPSDNRPPLKQYEGKTHYVLLMCSMEVQLASLGGEGDYQACILAGKTVAKASFDKALRTVKKPKAQEALKAYHVAFVSAVEGVSPGPGEIRLSYEQRQQALKGRLTEAWARFEIEQ